MKKSFFAFLILFSFSTLYSQTFQGGLTGGINASRVDNDGHGRYGKMGLNAGFFVAREIMDNTLFWQMEIRYSSRGKYDRGIDPPYEVAIMDLKYIELPLSLHYNVNEKFQPKVGLAPDMLIKEAYYDEDGPVSSSGSNTLHQFGLTAFAGMNYFFNEKIAIGAQLNYSVFPFYRFPGTAIRYFDRGYFHSVISINMKYYINR